MFSVGYGKFLTKISAVLTEIFAITHYSNYTELYEILISSIFYLFIYIIKKQTTINTYYLWKKEGCLTILLLVYIPTSIQKKNIKIKRNNKLLYIHTTIWFFNNYFVLYYYMLNQSIILYYIAHHNFNLIIYYITLHNNKRLQIKYTNIFTYIFIIYNNI